METPLQTTSAQDGNLPRVTITQGPGAGASFYCDKAELVIGRATTESEARVALADGVAGARAARARG